VSNLVTTALEAGQDVNIYVLVESGTNECLLLLFIVPIYLDFRRLSPVAAESIHSRPDATELDTFGFAGENQTWNWVIGSPGQWVIPSVV